MGIANLIVVISGLITLLFGIGAIFYPNLARWINVPGNPSSVIKAFVAIITGIIIILIGLLIQIPS